ncbi:MAG: DsbA family protein [Acidimicrobiia bacterium]|nr:DsbA family protein [Acidimicrobiia bacterium]
MTMEQPNTETPDRELIYVGDPMCSWCWGIAPELDQLTAAHPELPLRIVVGGLRPGPNAQEVGPDLAGYLAHHWEEVERRSGQPFDRTLLDRHGWLYDTEPACRAVVVMRELAPHETFRFFKRLQRAFYAEGRPVWDPEAFGELIDGFDVDPGEFLDAFGSQDSVKATWLDFSLARSWGINGFPTIVLRQGSTGQIIARGYTTADDMELVIGSLI